MTTAAVLAVLAAGFAAWSGWSWYAAAHDDTLAYARARDRALAAAEQGARNLNTLDHRKLAAGLDRWERSSTGELRQQLKEGRSEFAKRVREARTTTTGEVLSGAVTELDTRAGRASVLIALRITVDAPDEKPTAKESRMVGQVSRTGDGGWKLSALGQAPAGNAPADGDKGDGDSKGGKDGKGGKGAGGGD
ncbi:hypothetical protein G5C65_05045 [Streptomyces sp. SB3404]|uniref:Mce-associated membrane protein n=1 Tax=Streptomyces boncukensis TaxID=2711219 RepID=A0A6G4WSW0_9ACTN|nr:hypothetical protein [Streptomyces boncukensis]